MSRCKLSGGAMFGGWNCPAGVNGQKNVWGTTHLAPWMPRLTPSLCLPLVGCGHSMGKGNVRVATQDHRFTCSSYELCHCG